MTGSDASGGHDVAVIVDDAAWSACRDVEALVRRAADAALAGEPGATATVLLADDATLRELNGRFRDLHKPTNVLSFPSGAPGGPADACHLGDVAIAFGTVAREAAELHRPIADHLSHLVVHGMLHLLGHDHEADAEAELMEQTETCLLAGLGIADPYREPA